MRLWTGLIAVMLLVGMATTASGGTYMLFDDWGGTWADAEKNSVSTEDDLLCWAAAASNLLEWTGWGAVGGMATTDDFFGYYENHWTDESGNPWYALDWWFDGTNDRQGVAGWSQVDVAGGGFWPSETFTDHAVWSGDDSAIMSNLDSWLHAGYGVSFWVGTVTGGAHFITPWGFTFDDSTGDYTGVYVTDSDDDKDGSPPRPDHLRFYSISLSSGHWYLQDYFQSDSWYVGEVLGLKAMPAAAVPLPSAAWAGMALLAVLAACVRARSRRKCA